MKQKIYTLTALLCLLATGISYAQDYAVPKFEKQNSFFYHGFFTPSYIEVGGSYVAPFNLQAIHLGLETQAYRNDYFNLTFGLAKTGFPGIHKGFSESETLYKPHVNFVGPDAQLIFLPDSKVHLSYRYQYGKGRLDLPSDYTSNSPKRSFSFGLNQHQVSLVCKVTKDLHLVASGNYYDLKASDQLAQLKRDSSSLYDEAENKGYSLGIRFTTM